MMQCLFDDELILSFCYSDLTLETGGFELASSITLVLQANRLTKCASHAKGALTFASPGFPFLLPLLGPGFNSISPDISNL